jgi:hypothetical protein
MNNDREMSLDELDKVTGGQYDPDVEYTRKYAACGGNLYKINDIREIAGQLQVNQEVELHPDFEYYCNGKVYCIVRVNGVDYMTERENIN